MMAGSETSFGSYTFTYKWKINDLATRIYNPNGLISPTVCSPNGATPATKWRLTVSISHYEGGTQRGPRRGQPTPTDDEQLSAFLGLELKRQPVDIIGPVTVYIGGASKRGPSKEREADLQSVWAEVSLTPFISTGDAVRKCTRISQRPVCCILSGSNVIRFQNFLTASKILGSNSVTLECEIKVWLLDKSVHVNKEPLSLSSKSDFNLGKCMEEARQNGLFTDVTLVADGREFKAHKVVLASRSQFFKTRFASRWSGSAGDKVEMTDISASIMEAILSYMYTGTVTDIDKIAYKLLPVAEEYALVGLRGMCEETLAKSLTISSAVDVLIHTDAHNTINLKKACMEFILLNIASVKQSEGWSKLKKEAMHRDLWVELLESITEKHFAASTTVSAPTKSEKEAEPEDPAEG